ncbi:hypothetical protein CEXT_15371 [Caerostris extrusa]|uniref:Uncharacterized protein n=1 Tax=Caerostris extrusa TaxID=172846 RepID=A0AAV4VD51_CAEEX|nr:hypothetical protein CEXT_15371 [Caerostris extrusa]
MPEMLLRMEGLLFCSRSSCSHVFGQISERAQASKTRLSAAPAAKYLVRSVGEHKREQNTTFRKVMDDIYLREEGSNVDEGIDGYGGPLETIVVRISKCLLLISKEWPSTSGGGMDIYPFKRRRAQKKVMPKKLLGMEGLLFCSRNHVFGQISERAQARAKHDFPESNG